MPTNDFFFKKIFGSVGSEKITKSLLEAILKIEITAIDLDKNPITEKELLDDKLGVMDIRLEINGNIVLTDKIKVYILELPKIERMNSEDKNLNLWIKFIKDLEVKHMAENEEKDEKLEETIKAIQEAKKKYEELCQDEHARYIAELREKYVEETASVRQMGYEEGQEKEKKEIAKMMKDNNYSMEEIMKMTKLSKEDIEKL